MTIVLFIREANGDNNYKGEFPTVAAAKEALAQFRIGGGYWLIGKNRHEYFIPWHRVNYARIEIFNA